MAGVGSLRGLVVLTCAMAGAESMLFSLLSPMLPSFEEDFLLSKGQVGLLVAMFPVGIGFTALPAGLLASRIGVKRLAEGSLVVLALTGLAFGVVGSYRQLLVVRFLQGGAAGAVWASGLAWLVETAPRARRGQMIGLFVGAGAAGQVLGPVVGALAVVVGRAGAFAGFAGLAVLLAIAGTRFAAPVGGERPSLAPLRTASGLRIALRGQWFVVLPGLLLGMILVLAPLQLNRLGWGTVRIAETFLVAAAAGVAARPAVGRWADSHGTLRVECFLLLASIPITLIVPWAESPWLLSLFVVCAVTIYGAQWGPAMAAISHAYHEARIAQVLGFALVGLAAGIGLFVGSAAGGEIARRAGDAIAYGMAAGVCLASFVALLLVSKPTAVPAALQDSWGLAARTPEAKPGSETTFADDL